ncbi:MAG: hypothetical protein OEV02_03455 [Gammaproteobacteria bacterium]|jgi:hypothetical protein|nr:hypothetical protein [Gammaproteobacteria bacterium]
MAFPNDLEKAVAMAYARADVVFLGEATAIRNTFLGILRQREVTFSVRDRWKGSIPDTALVRTNSGEIACGYNFKKRNSYLVFAYWDQQRKRLTTSFCELNRTEAKAKDAITVLDRLRKRANAAARQARIGSRSSGSLSRKPIRQRVHLASKYSAYSTY